MKHFMVGIDEAGRGPLAGPVAIGIAVVPTDFDWSLLRGVTDSKHLSEKERERLFLAARELRRSSQLQYTVIQVGAHVIDRDGISRAIASAIARGCKRLALDPAACSIKLDGSLKAPAQFRQQETIIKGDASEPIIGLASILAKVTRDRYMVRQSATPTGAPYDFAAHKGYGTKAHREAIATHGLSPIHRASYCKNIVFGGSM